MIGAEVAVPTHYAFQGSWFTDTFILDFDGTPERFEAASHKRAPGTQVRVLPPGQRLTIVRTPAAGPASAGGAARETGPRSASSAAPPPS